MCDLNLLTNFLFQYLTHETKVRVYNGAERDDQGSKVMDFFEKTEDMFNEMKWQKKLRGYPLLFLVSSFKISCTLRTTQNFLVVVAPIIPCEMRKK